MQTLLSLSLTVALLALAAPYDLSATQASEAPCDALELRATPNAPPAYQSALCEGVEHEQNGELEEAFAQYRRALAVPLHEVPNFVLLPRIAALAGRLGDSETAQHLEAEAEVAFGIYFGLFLCSPVAPNAPPIGAEGFDPVTASRAAERMCGAAREWVYQRSTMAEFIADLPVLEIYQAHQPAWTKR